MLGEVDAFQLTATDELYSQMNVNYVRADRLPNPDNSTSLLQSIAQGRSFISTGEITIPRSTITSGPGGTIEVKLKADSTFPLRMAEVVWGDGKTTHVKRFDLSETHEFEHQTFHWNVDAPDWTWARAAVWDIAAEHSQTQRGNNNQESPHLSDHDEFKSDRRRQLNSRITLLHRRPLLH